jgi:hypothetical protein
MNKFPLQTTIVYDNKSSSNPSLITAGFPSSSIMTSRLIQPSSTTKQNYYLNQNRATDTQPMSLNSQKTSDIYLNLSRKDIDDLMTALHTLVQHVYQSSSSYILDQFICIDQNEPISNIQMLPQQAHSLQIHDQINFNKIDVATQWSLQILTPTSSTDILTELSQSKTTITTNNSAVHTPLISKVHSFMDTSSISLNKKKIKRTSIKRMIISY